MCGKIITIGINICVSSFDFLNKTTWQTQDIATNNQISLKIFGFIKNKQVPLEL